MGYASRHAATFRKPADQAIVDEGLLELQMPFLGTIINVLTVLVGGLIGISIGNRLPVRIKDVLLNGLGLGTTLIGLGMALETENELLIIGALLFGGIVGEILRIEQRLDHLAESIRAAAGSDSPTFVNGFVSATILFCVGPMTFIGSVQDGMGDSRLLLMKALLDGFASLALASALGVGVVFSAVAVLVIQGALAMLGRTLGQMGDPLLVTELSAVGGLMIMGIGINLLGLKKIPVASFLPAFLFVPLLIWIVRMW